MENRHIPKKSFRRRILDHILTLLVAYIVVLAMVRIFESHLIFFPNYPDRLEGNWHPPGLNVQDVWLTTSDDVRLHAWWIPGDGARFTFMAFHGNASNIADRAPVYEFLRSTHANVFAVEYRGYGHSEGKPSEVGVYRDAEAAYEYLVNIRRIDPKSIISFGQSLGTAVATHLAAQHKVGGVVLEAPFPSASRVARKVLWFLPGAGLLAYRQFNTQAWIEEIRAPILIVHCTQDPVIPFEFGQEVYEAALPPKNFLQISGTCHEEASLVSPTRYHAVLQNFLNSL